ncbi:MAG TPA: TPM domain-containing protein, partial [Nitrososphaera sp.]|nr:TPM domain-containing protein [Nitrososphaera sp.]
AIVTALTGLFVGLHQIGFFKAENKPAPESLPATPTPTENSKSPLPLPTSFVSDYAGVIDDRTEQRLEAMLTDLQKQSKIEFGVVTVENTGNQNISNYALAVVRGWGIGPKDPNHGGGILLLVSIADREWYIHRSKSLEKDMPVETINDLGKLMNEPFRQKKYGVGISQCVETIISRLADNRGFKITKV